MHVACIENNALNGVCVAVPQHVRAQATFAEVALLNVRGEEIAGIERQIPYEKEFDVRALTPPFNAPDLVVFHEAYRAEYLRIYKNLQKNQIPYIILPHGELRKEAQRKKRWKKLAANLLFFNKFIRGALAVQCLSQMEKENTRFGRRKIVGSNGVFLPKNYKTSFNEKEIRIVYIGRLEVRVKGLDLLMRAVKITQRELKAASARLDIYGPDYQGRYERVRGLIAENGVGDIVELHREVSGEEKENILLDSDIFIQVSRHEGMPMGILEAMSYGLPCLITEGTTLKAFVEAEDGGWAAETSAESIAAALKRAIAEKELFSRKSANARAAVAREFAWQEIAEKTVKAYREILQKK